MTEYGEGSMENPEISLEKRLEDGKWRVRIKGITSGFVVHLNDCDEGVIDLFFDATRFNPILKVDNNVSVYPSKRSS